jgi:radical SAM protein with 4Fe4S-binding SPASM domain
MKPKIQASIELTNYCNMKCRFCPHAVYKQPASPSGNLYNRPQGYMTDETFARVLENAQHYREIVLGFFGEQTLHPKFTERVRALREATTCHMVLNSNWSYVTAEMMETIKLFDTVRISIDAVDPATYEKLCPGGAFLDLAGNKTEQRYDTLVKKILYWFGLVHPETWLIFVTSSVNAATQGKFVDYWLPKTPQHDSVVTKRVVSYGGVMGDSRMARHPCYIHEQNRVVIAWNGDVSPCNLDVNMELAAGNLLREPNLLSLTASDQWRARLNAIKRRKGICANCFDSNNHTENVRRAGRKRP